MTKWFVYGHESHDETLGNDIIGTVETFVEDITDAKRNAQIKYGAANVAYVTRACHSEERGGKWVTVND